jgi:DNA ligase-1
MTTTELPMLYGLSRTNVVKQWQIAVQENDDGTATMITQSGYVNKKIRDIPKLIKKGKNIGRANETTPFQQAVSEAESKWNGKRYENYELEMIDPDNYIPRLMLPQCASDPRKGKIIFPAYIQPKFNGVCDLAEYCHSNAYPPIIQHHSRGGHLFETLEHLDKWLLSLHAPAPVHGELYYHGWSLQTIGSYTKKIKPDQDKLEYWLYDMAWVGPVFEERMGWLDEHVPLLEEVNGVCNIKLAPTFIVNDYAEAKFYHDEFVQQGYEGGMLKNKKGVYIFQHDSKDIEKVKEFEDDEFEIVGGKEGTGGDTGCIIYRCITESGLEFDARPRGTVEKRQLMFQNLQNDIGKKLTVRFAEYSDVGIPLQPVGVPVAEAVRDYE